MSRAPTAGSSTQSHARPKAPIQPRNNVPQNTKSERTTRLRYQTAGLTKFSRSSRRKTPRNFTRRKLDGSFAG